MREFQTLDALLNKFGNLGSKNIYCKFLAENDNTKQQIYLGKNFDVLRLLRFGNVVPFEVAGRPNFKAKIPLVWINADDNISEAPGAQLILYPDYPEVRLSGFIKNSILAPSKLLQPVPKGFRKTNNGHDGRVLFFGVSENTVYSYLAGEGTAVAKEAFSLDQDFIIDKSGPLREILRTRNQDSRQILLDKVKELSARKWNDSCKLSKEGIVQPYEASNGVGYTLEAFFGIIPNSKSAPDFMGWELKAYGKSPITLMTPEPTAGYYGEHGVAAFLRKYGYLRKDDSMYFTGVHRIGETSKKTGHTLKLKGFDPASKKITDVGGGIQLIDAEGEVAAEWNFAGLIEHWGRKHASAAYIPYMKSKSKPTKYFYHDPLLMGEGTDFQFFLSALAAGHVFYDPAPKLENASAEKSKTKARNQFRIKVKNLEHLYVKLNSVKFG